MSRLSFFLHGDFIERNEPAQGRAFPSRSRRTEGKASGNPVCPASHARVFSDRGHGVCSRKLFSIILVIVFPFLSAAQETFSGEKAFSFIQKLCSPEFEGRKTGLPGAEKAASWIGGKFGEWGLYPGGDSGFYLQRFPMLSTRQEKRTVFRLKNGFFGPVTYQEGNDFNLYFNSGSGKVKAEVVFTGFGISAPEKGWDDYAGIDVRGKIVVIHRGTPSDGQSWAKENERDEKVNQARSHGAAALLMFENREGFSIRGGTLHEAGYQPSMPAMSVTSKVARDIFQGTLKSLEDVLAKLATSPQSFRTGKIAEIDVRVKKIPSAYGENVIGFFPGVHPVLKNECIVVGAHMDHNGLSPDGHLYAGADDNASGTAIVMELARVMSRIPGGLRRTVCFVCFGGEEQGLLGSSYFAEHPAVPGEQIVAMFNFDMEGMGDGGCGAGGRNYFPDLFDGLLSGLADSVRQKFRVSRGWGMGGSDHAHFIEQGIPALGFFSTGSHPFYHQAEDVPSVIHVPSLQCVGDRAFELIRTIADAPHSLLYDGCRSGRTFMLFGDQIDFSLNRHTRKSLEEEKDAYKRSAPEYGMRACFLPLNEEKTAMSPLALYSAIDEMSEWIRSDQEHWIRFQNGGSLSQAGSDGRIALGLALDGTACLNRDLALFRHVSRLGIDLLRLHDADDPVFGKESLSAFGKGVLGICSVEGIPVLLDAAESSMLHMLEEHTGPVVVFRDWEQMAGDLRDLKRFLEGKKRLLVLHCDSSMNAAALSDVIDVLGDHEVHLSVVTEGMIEKAVPEYDRISWKHCLAQKLVEERLRKHDKAAVYEEMVRLFGGNLRKVLN